MSGRSIIDKAVVLLAAALLWGAAPASAQYDAFPYPTMPDSLREPQARADYALMH